MSKKNFDRRAFLQTSALSAFGFMASATLGATPGAWRNLFPALATEAEAAEVASGHTLLYVFCRGGMDSLSLFPPLEPNLRAAYNSRRPNIRFNANPIVNVSGNVQAFGVNDQMPDLKDLLDNRDMLVIYGAGSTNNSTSHFDQMNYIEGGSSVKKLSEGFFQRLAVAANFTSKTDLVAVESVIPRSLMGTEFVFQYRNPQELVALAGAGVEPGVSKAERLQHNFSAIGKVRDIASAYADASANVYAKVNAVPLASIPNGDLAEAGRLIVAGVAPRVLTVSVSGWDFHEDLQNRLLVSGPGTELAKSLRALRDLLKANGKWNSTTIVVMSEFGRRMAENGSLGADHGRGGTIMVLGGGIRHGGRVIMKPDLVSRMVDLYNPALNDVTQSNIPVDFDFRAVLAEVFQKRFGLDMSVPSPIFNGEAMAGLGQINALLG